MINRIALLAAGSILILGLAGCVPEQAPPPKTENASTPSKPAEPEGPYYELTKDDITSHPNWMSRNITIFGAKLGDVTRNVEKNLGPANQDATRNIGQDYLTVYQNNGLFVFTFKNTGKARKFQVYQTLAAKIADPKLKRLVTTGDLKLMRDILGPEERVEESAEDPEAPATEYVYDSRGFRFIKYRVKGQILYALLFGEVKKVS